MVEAGGNLDPVGLQYRKESEAEGRMKLNTMNSRESNPGRGVDPLASS